MINLSPDDLKDLPQLTGTAPEIDVTALPADPRTLFIDWFQKAREVVAEPKACTLATVDVNGRPDARTVDLYSVSEDGISFATAAGSDKVAQLHENSHAALNFYWQALARAVRVRGTVYESDGPAPGLRVFTIEPEHLEFWQPDTNGEPIRIQYDRLFGRWRHAVV